VITTPQLMRDLFQSGSNHAAWQANDLAKHVWMDLYADLYRQCFGETSSSEAIVLDALARRETLKANRLMK
jgi:hypothetical protein